MKNVIKNKNVKRTFYLKSFSSSEPKSLFAFYHSDVTDVFQQESTSALIGEENCNTKSIEGQNGRGERNF